MITCQGTMVGNVCHGLAAWAGKKVRPSIFRSPSSHALGVSLCTCYEKPGTDTAYCATHALYLRPVLTRVSWYACAMRSPVLTGSIVLRSGYAATRRARGLTASLRVAARYNPAPSQYYIYSTNERRILTRTVRSISENRTLCEVPVKVPFLTRLRCESTEPLADFCSTPRNQVQETERAVWC
eukprot:816085-Rhodomonas_salina.1